MSGVYINQWFHQQLCIVLLPWTRMKSWQKFRNWPVSVCISLEGHRLLYSNYFQTHFFKNLFLGSDLGSCREICYLLSKADGKVTTSPCLWYPFTCHFPSQTSLLSSSFSVCLQLLEGLWESGLSLHCWGNFLPIGLAVSIHIPSLSLHVPSCVLWPGTFTM